MGCRQASPCLTIFLRYEYSNDDIYLNFKALKVGPSQGFLRLQAAFRVLYLYRFMFMISLDLLYA